MITILVSVIVGLSALLVCFAIAFHVKAYEYTQKEEDYSKLWTDYRKLKKRYELKTRKDK